jgi:hypothetical protein
MPMMATVNILTPLSETRSIPPCDHRRFSGRCTPVSNWSQLLRTVVLSGSRFVGCRDVRCRAAVRSSETALEKDLFRLKAGAFFAISGCQSTRSQTVRAMTALAPILGCLILPIVVPLPLIIVLQQSYCRTALVATDLLDAHAGGARCLAPLDLAH